MSANWNRFWFAPAPRHLLCSLRIFWGTWIVCKWTGAWGLHRLPWSPRWPNLTVRSLSEYTEMGAPMPVPGFSWVTVPPLWLRQEIDASIPVLGLLLAVGLGTRVVAPALLLLIGWNVVASQFTWRHHFGVMLVVLLVLSLWRCNEHWSVDARIRPRPVVLRPILPLRLVQVLTTTVYASTLIGKLNEGWWDGTVIQLLHDRGHLDGPFVELFHGLLGPRLIANGTVFVEGLLAFGLWVPRLRPWAIFLGVCLHTGIDLMMPVTTFSYQITSMYLSFLDPFPRQTQAVVPTWLWPLRYFDWLGRVRWEREVPVGTTTPATRVTLPNGQRREGFRAGVELMQRLPILFPAGFVVGVVLRVYDLFFRRRAGAGTSPVSLDV